jgi:hypothetical protein
MTTARTLPLNTMVTPWLALAGSDRSAGRVARPSRAEQDAGLDARGAALAWSVLVEWDNGARTWEWVADLRRLPSR